jgi:hypothetical protein
MEKETKKSQTKLKQPWLSNNFGSSLGLATSLDLEEWKKKLWNLKRSWSVLGPVTSLEPEE